jgi:hypothetical protein
LVHGKTDGFDLAGGEFMSSGGLAEASNDLVVDQAEKQQFLATAKKPSKLEFEIDSLGSIERKRRRLLY